MHTYLSGNTYFSHVAYSKVGFFKSFWKLKENLKNSETTYSFIQNFIDVHIWITSRRGAIASIKVAKSFSIPKLLTIMILRKAC